VTRYELHIEDTECSVAPCRPFTGLGLENRHVHRRECSTWEVVLVAANGPFDVKSLAAGVRTP
jgi:hypothetical protein